MEIDDDEVVYDEDIAYFLENCKLEDIVFTLPYETYSYWRARQLLREEFGVDMISLHGGYKANRYRQYLSYKLVLIESGETVAERVNLHQIRRFLAKYRFPLHEPKTKRRQACVRFLEAVEAYEGREDNDET